LICTLEKTVASGASEADIIEKNDIGGISLIRAAAKLQRHCNYSFS
jgi:AICAR transformylase/IMP cyclohydrolase PurH